MSTQTPEQSDRSMQFAHFLGKEVLNGDRVIQFYNPDGRQVFDVDPKATEESVRFLKSGAVQVVIPAKNELQYGYYPSVLQHMITMVGKENVLVVDADSYDGTGDHAVDVGVETIRQGDIEAFYYGDRIQRDFDVEWPLPPGKGRTILATNIYQSVVQDAHKQFIGRAVPTFNLYSDADIKNSVQFDHPKWLAWVATHYPEGMLAEVKAAQHSRNNQAVMNTLAMLQSDNPVIRHYFQGTKELVWPLTGQFMKTQELLRRLPNALGYGTEMISNMAVCDLVADRRMKRAQVEIPVRCEDGENSSEKETAMMTSISALILMLNERIFRQGKRLVDMQPEDYRAMNAILRDREKDFVISAIRETGFGPNLELSIRLDRLLPSAEYLVRNGYVNTEEMNKFYLHQ